MEKNILVVAATSFEISPFLKDLKKTNGVTESNKTDVLISGIGLTASTYSISAQLRLKHYDLVIQAGVAGCFDTTIDLGDVVVIKQDTIADQSVVELNKLKSLFDLKLVPHNSYPYNKGWLINPGKDILKRTRLKMVRGISVNQISTDKRMIKFYRDMFDPITESMEGAALHYVCRMENVPFLQIRSISNYIGERNKKKWNMNDSVASLNDSLIRIVNNY